MSYFNSATLEAPDFSRGRVHKEECISLVKDGYNLYVEYKDQTDKKHLQAPKRLRLGKFFKYDRRQGGGQQPRGYFVSANELENGGSIVAGLTSFVYDDSNLGEFQHKEKIEPNEKALKRTQAEKVGEEMAGTSVSESGSGTEAGTY